MITQITSFGRECQEKNADFSAPTIRALLGRMGGLPSANGRSPLAAYLHVPFCFHKCHYCDFYSIVEDDDRRMEAFTTHLIDEMQAGAELFERQVETIFVGGGTPTLLPVAQWQRLLDAIRAHLLGGESAADRDIEFTVEANPETVTPELAATLAAGGVNRISLGAQSFQPQHLKTLERHHDPENVARAVTHFRAAGIQSINLDLIFGIPNQTLDDWRDDLDRAIALEPDHLSCYGLMYEPNTPLTRKMQMGRVQPIDDALEAEMYEWTMDRLGEAGFEHYEISAWAKPGKRCQHNLIYWHNHNWWPFGPSASGHMNGLRWKNVPRLGSYLEQSPLPTISDVELPDRERAVNETLMLRLRLLDGIARDELDQLLAMSDRSEALRKVFELHCASGLLYERDGRLTLTRKGLLQADSVLVDLI